MSFENLLSVVIAIGLGALIGIEREMSSKPAGLRTNVLICLGAAIFTIIAKELGGENTDAASRIIAQIITGVGFIGAGAILHTKSDIQGLTSAATIWLVAAIGIACGAQYYMIAVVTTVIVFAVLLVLAQIDKIIPKKEKTKDMVE